MARTKRANSAAITKLIIAEGLSQVDLEREGVVNTKTLRKALNEEPLSVRVLQRLADRLKVPLSEIVLGDVSDSVDWRSAMSIDVESGVYELKDLRKAERKSLIERLLASPKLRWHLDFPTEETESIEQLKDLHAAIKGHQEHGGFSLDDATSKHQAAAKIRELLDDLNALGINFFLGNYRYWPRRSDVTRPYIPDDNETIPEPHYFDLIVVSRKNENTIKVRVRIGDPYARVHFERRQAELDKKEQELFPADRFEDYGDADDDAN